MALKDSLGKVRTLLLHKIIKLHYTGVEKNNSDARRNYLSSNHMDGPLDVLRTEARLECLTEYSRVKRGYEKKDMEYWEKRIFDRRSLQEKEMDY